jgi:hypothetical protein
MTSARTGDQVASVATPAPPHDPALPRLSTVLDRDEISPVLQRSLGDVPLRGVRVAGVHYEPGKRLVVRYEAKLDDAVAVSVGMISSSGKLAGVVAHPSSLALAALAAPRSPAVTPLVYEPSLGLLLQWLPLDIRLPALAEPPERLRQRVRAAGVQVAPRGDDPPWLTYRPRRHAVLRLGRHILKLYAADRALQKGVSALRFYSTVPAIRTARLEAVVPELRMTVQTLLPGRRQTASAESAAEAGGVLASLHGTDVNGRAQNGLPVASPSLQLERAVETAAYLSVLEPPLQRPLRALVERLAAATPTARSLVPSHGDFNVAQLLKTRAGVAVVDLDRVCVAPPALDPASYGAYLVRGRPGDLETALAALDHLIAGYGRRPAHLAWYLSTMILRRGARPFRALEADWRDGVAEMVASAEAALRS